MLILSADVSALSNISAESAVLLNADTHEGIYDKNMHKVSSMASTTKIMTAILAVESGKLNCTVEAKHNFYTEGTAIGIKKGYVCTLENLVYAMMLESGNDAAVLVAEFLSGSEKDFSLLMNKKAKEIGMNSTNFVTASGLDDKHHYTTAYDMAVLGAYAIKNPVFRKICSEKIYSFELIKPEISFTFNNHNKLMGYYEGVFGIKTGFTKKSGRCLVSSCEKDGAVLVAVTLNAPDDWNDHIKLYNYGYDSLKSVNISQDIPDEIRVYGSDKEVVSIGIFSETFKSFNNQNIRYEVYLNKWLYAPIKKQDVVGYVKIYNSASEVNTIEIKALENAECYFSDKQPEYKFRYKMKKVLVKLKGWN